MYKLCRSIDDLARLDSYDPEKPIFCDTETTYDRHRSDLSKDPGGLYGRVRLLQCYQEGEKQALLFDCFFIPLHSVLERIESFTLVFHNASYDLHTINCHTPEFWYPREVHDTFYLSKAHFSEQERFGFYECLRHAGLEDDTIRSIDKKSEQKSDWSKTLTPQQLEYAAIDVFYLSLLYPIVAPAMDFPCEIDHANLKAAVEYDRTGIPISRRAINILRTETLLRHEKYTSLVPVNINSPKQCQEWLGVKSTDAYTIGTMALKGNEDAENLVQARKADKLLQFIEKYDNDRVKCFHNACGARTSRMTATGGDIIFAENNQNIPRPLYPCIQAPEGRVIVYKDYAGLELRMAVAYIGEPTMSQLMFDGIDMHTFSACKIFGVTEETMVPQQRWVTKVFTFSSIYGAGPVELQNQLQAKGRIHMEFEEVKSIGKRWFQLYEYFQEWHNLHRKMMKVYGYIDVTTLLGRRIRAFRLNDSFNIPIQGSAAEVTKLGVKLLTERYKGSNIINVVHDSVSLEQDEDDAEIWVDRLNECLIDAWFEVIQHSAIPDLPMPPEAQARTIWPGCDETDDNLIERGIFIPRPFDLR